jgi:hypothetical protein
VIRLVENLIDVMMAISTEEMMLAGMREIIRIAIETSSDTNVIISQGLNFDIRASH